MVERTGELEAEMGGGMTVYGALLTETGGGMTVYGALEDSTEYGGGTTV